MKLVSIVAAVLLLTGCTDAETARGNASGKEHIVTLYSDGREVRTWRSTGKVQPNETGSSFYFMDKETKRLVRVSGNLVIEVAE